MTDSYVTHAHCTICGKRYLHDKVIYACSTCGPAGTLDIHSDLPRLMALTPENLPDRWDMWRYGPLLPINDERFIPPLPIGWTPLIPAPRLAELLGLRSLWLKDEGRNPTG